MLTLTIQLDSIHPLYQQLHDSIAAQIRSGQLSAGDRLPGKRSLASQLAVAVNTVDTAYQMLVAEGYLESRPKSGFFVLPYTDTLKPPAQPVEIPVPPRSVSPFRFDLSTGSVDTALFPFRTWGRIQKDLLYAGSELLSHGHHMGDENLRSAITEYLRAYRGVECHSSQIVVGAGMEFAPATSSSAVLRLAHSPLLRIPATPVPAQSLKTAVWRAAAPPSTTVDFLLKHWRPAVPISAMLPPATTSPLA